MHIQPLSPFICSNRAVGGGGSLSHAWRQPCLKGPALPCCMYALWKQTCLTLMPPQRQLGRAEARARGSILQALGDGCVYCGEKQTSQDHFRPVVGHSGMPTGYCNDLWNVVPCCTCCNSSKGKKHWNVFLRGVTPRSPRGRRVRDWRRRENLLHTFEQEGDVHLQRWEPAAGVRAALVALRARLCRDVKKHKARVVALKAACTSSGKKALAAAAVVPLKRHDRKCKQR